MGGDFISASAVPHCGAAARRKEVLKPDMHQAVNVCGRTERGDRQTGHVANELTDADPFLVHS